MSDVATAARAILDGLAEAARYAEADGYSVSESWYSFVSHKDVELVARAALDVVRRSPQGERIGSQGPAAKSSVRIRERIEAGRTPQGEDHEAEIEALKADLAEFQEGLTRALNRHGVPATPSWDAAIDWLAENGGRTPQGEDHMGYDRADTEFWEDVRRDPQGEYPRGTTSPCTPISDEDAAALDALADHPKPGKIGSPQGEDHEAGCIAAWRALGQPVGGLEDVRKAIAAYLSRCPSPERKKLIVDWTENGDPILLDPSVGPPHPVVGTHDLPCPSPERDTEKLVEALREIVRLSDTDGPAAPLLVTAGDLAGKALAEFSDASKETP